MKTIIEWVKKFLGLPYKIENIEKDVSLLKKNVSLLKDEHREVREALVKEGLIKPFTISRSPKEITERGHEFLKKYKIAEFLKQECDLLKEDFTGKSDFEVFHECFKWVKEKGKLKTLELMYNSNISKEQCIELLALAIRDEIYRLKREK